MKLHHCSYMSMLFLQHILCGIMIGFIIVLFRTYLSIFLWADWKGYQSKIRISDINGRANINKWQASSSFILDSSLLKPKATRPSPKQIRMAMPARIYMYWLKRVCVYSKSKSICQIQEMTSH